MDGAGAEAAGCWELTLGLASGRTAGLRVWPEDRLVRRVRALATRTFERHVTGLVGPGGALLLDAQTLDEAGVQDGDVLTAVVGQVVLYPTRPAAFGAFAAVVGQTFLAAWGHPSSLREPGPEVRAAAIRHVAATAGAFAALLSDGRVVSWGSYSAVGGHDVAPGAVLSIYSTDHAFAVLCRGGRVAAWGCQRHGGDCSDVQAQLQEGVRHVFSTSAAFAAVTVEGAVVTWGDGSLGGDSRKVREQLFGGVRWVYSNNRAFAAVKESGEVVTWGTSSAGGDSDSIHAELQGDVSFVASSAHVFAAVKTDGAVVVWGNREDGGDASRAQPELAGGVRHVCSTSRAFAAVKQGGRVVAWGAPECGGDCSAVAGSLSEVEEVYGNEFAFAAVRRDGGVVTWGDEERGGDSSAKQAQLTDVQQICATSRAFAALSRDGAVVSWGSPLFGGSAGRAAAELQSGVATLFSTTGAFGAGKSDGRVVTWGGSWFGGDSSAVHDVLNPRGAALLPHSSVEIELRSEVEERLVEFALQGSRRIGAVDCQLARYDEAVRPMGVCLEIGSLERPNPHRPAKARLTGRFRFWLVEAPQVHEHGFALGRCEAFFDTPLPPADLAAPDTEGEATAAPTATQEAASLYYLFQEQLVHIGEGGRHVFQEHHGDVPVVSTGAASTSAALERLSFWALGALLTDEAERRCWLSSLDTRARLHHCRVRLETAGSRPVLNLPGARSWMSPGQSAFGSFALLVAILALFVAKALGYLEPGAFRGFGGGGRPEHHESTMQEALAFSQLLR